MVDEFKIHVDYDNGVIPIIHIAGEITSEADEEIVNCYASIPSGKKNRVLIDFSKTAYINSAGIATLISLITKAAEKLKIDASVIQKQLKTKVRLNFQDSILILEKSWTS